MGFLKNTKLIVSSRLHLNIFGACAGVPSIGLVRNRKIIDFAELLGMPYLELEKISVTTLEETVANLWESYDDSVNLLKLEVKKMRRQYYLSLIEVKETINNLQRKCNESRKGIS